MEIEDAITNLLDKIKHSKADDALRYSEAVLVLTKARATHVVTKGQIAQQEKKQKFT
jgi:hypothetical protein